mgnify:FL=1
MTLDTIRNAILSLIPTFPISRVILFGSRASGTNRDDSDVDLIMEFSEPITLLTLSDIKLRLENILGLSVDVVHGPLRESDILNISKEIEIYAA